MNPEPTNPDNNTPNDQSAEPPKTFLGEQPIGPETENESESAGFPVDESTEPTPIHVSFGSSSSTKTVVEPLPPMDEPQHESESDESEATNPVEPAAAEEPASDAFSATESDVETDMPAAEPVAEPVAESVTEPSAFEPVTPPVVSNPMETMATEPETPAAPGIVVGTTPTADLPPEPPKAKKSAMHLSKRLLLAVGIPLVILLLAAGGYFGLYLPTTPAAVWHTGITRSGKALDKVVLSATETKKLESYKTSQITGHVTATVNGSTYSGSINSQFDDAHSNSAVQASFPNSSDAKTTQKLDAQVLTELPKNATFPDVYFKINGIKSLGLDAFMPGISDYDNQWIEASSDYLKSLGSSATGSDQQKQPQITAANVAEIARTASSVTKDYVFSTDAKKGVFEEQSFVGKEKVNGISTYHYKATVNTAHANAYCVALSNAVLSTNAYKQISGQSADKITKQKKSAADDCNKPNTNNDFNSTFDLWVDSKYKLIHKIRVYEKKKPANYLEFGQNYKGGDDLNFFLNYTNAADKMLIKSTAGINTKTNIVNGTLDVTGGSGSGAYSVHADVTAKPLAKPVTITKPASAAQLKDVLNKLGLGDLANMVGTDQSQVGTTSGLSNSDDVIRQTSVQALQVQLEAYFAAKGSYPTLANLASASWRSTNMPSADASLFSSQYSYQPAGCTASGCTSYTLTVTLSDGSKYTKTSLD